MLRRACTAVRRPSAVATAPAAAAAVPSHVATRRSYVHAFLRPPFKTAIPSFATHAYDKDKGTVRDSDMNTVPINRDDFVMQYDSMVTVLRNTAIADSVHTLPSMGYFESTKISELMTSWSDSFLPMPRYGFEHRVAELNDTIRATRVEGAPSLTLDVLQSDETVRAVGTDFVLLPTGFVCGITSRTNEKAAQLLQGSYAYKEEMKIFPTVAAKVPTLQMPVQDVIGVAGQCTVLVWDTPEGHALSEVVATKGSRPWSFVKIEPGCYFLTFCGGLPRYEVIMDADFPRSIERAQKAGLVVHPIQWSEPKKIGLGMRPCVLVLTFAKGGMSGSGMQSQEKVVLSSGHNPREPNGRRTGSAGAPLYAQLMANELPPPVYQPPPRYAPPMHRPGALVSLDEEARKHTEDLKEKRYTNPSEFSGGFDWNKEGPEKWKWDDVQEDGRRYRPGSRRF